MKTQKCCICNQSFKGFGNNPSPIKIKKDDGRCCDNCNFTVVMPERIDNLERKK